MFKILLPAILAEISGKSVIKYRTTLQTHRHITSWNVCDQKSQRPKTEWNELPCKTQPFKTGA